MRNRRALPLKARLVATFALLLAASLATTAALAFHLTRRHLDRSLDERLLAASESFEAGPATSTGTLTARTRAWLSQQPVGSGTLIAVRVGPDRVLATSSELDAAELTGARTFLTSRSANLDTIDDPDGDVRVLSVPLFDGERYVGTFVAAARRAEVDATLSALMTGVGWAGLCVLALAVALSIVLVTAAFAPLTHIARAAAAIERTGDLSRRVSSDGPADEIGKLGRAFDSMLERLQRSFARQQTFLSDAAHEIRTPLTVARGELEWLQSSLTRPEDKEVLAVAVDEIDRVDRAVEDMLLLARLDEGAQLVTETVEVGLVMTEVALRAMTLTQRTVSVSAVDDIRALADERRLTQVIENLVMNALKYAGEDALVAMRAKEQGESVLIEVEDDGRGIPAEDLPHVFDRHFRGSSARSTEAPGAGLGLAIAKSLLEAMGGEIDVRSSPGEGTTFTVRLVREVSPAGRERPEGSIYPRDRTKER